MSLNRFARTGRHLDLILLDLGLLILTFYASTLLRPMLRGLPGLIRLTSVNIPEMLYLLIPILWIVVLIASGAYEQTSSIRRGLLRVAGGAALATIATAAFVYFVNREFSRWLLVLHSLLSLTLLLGWRIVFVLALPTEAKCREDGGTSDVFREGVGEKTRPALLRLNPPKTTIVLAFVLIGAFLRVYGIDKDSLWRDELQSWYQSDPSIRTSVADVTAFVTNSVHPPGHNILLYLLINEIGDSEFALRFPSAMAGVLAIAVMYALGCEFYTHREGILAAAFMTVLWMPIYFSQEVRPYGLLLFFSMLTMLLWTKLMKRLTRQQQPSLALAAGYIIAAILASYTHYFGLLLVALQGLGASLLLFRRREFIYVPVLYVPVAFAYAGWIRIVLFQAGRPSPAHLRANTAVLRQFFWFIFNRSGGLGRTPSVVPEGLGLIFFAFLLLMLLVIAIRFYKSSNRKLKNLFQSPTLLLLLWLVVPMISAYIISVQVNPVLSTKNLIIIAPAAYLLLARAILLLPLPLRLRYGIGASLILLFLLHLLFSIDYYSEPQKPQIREAVRYVTDRYQRYEGALIVGNRNGWYRYYFPEHLADRKVDIVIKPGETEYPRAIDEKLDKTGAEYLWFLNGFRQEPTQQLVDELNARLELIDHVSWHFAEARLYKR